MIKKILAGILALTMVFSLVPSAVFAEDTIIKRTNEGVSTSTNVTAEQMAKSLVGDGIEITDAKLVYANSNQVGFVTNGEPLLGISGCILSTGDFSACMGALSAVSGTAGENVQDKELAELITAEGKNYGGDTASLEFTMTATGTLLNFNYVFASSEFDQGENFNDIFGLFVKEGDGEYENIAKMPEGNPNYAGKNVTITNLREGIQLSDTTVKDNTYYYQDKNKTSGCTYNGFSHIFTAQKQVKAGEKVTVKFVIADVGDTSMDSSVIIQSGSLSFDAPGAKMDYSDEAIKGLENGTYEISADDVTYTFEVTNGQTIPVKGTDANKKAYDFFGKTISIVKVEGEEKSDALQITVASRPETPGQVESKNIQTDSENKQIEISNAEASQEYLILPAGTEITGDLWKNAVKPANGVVKITKDALGNVLDASKEYVMYTRVYATKDNPKSEASAPSGLIKFHMHTATVTKKAVAATCAKDGYTEEISCSVCGKILTASKVLKAIGHDWSGDWKVVKEATATQNGKKEKTCMREDCGYKRYDVIPATGAEKPDESDTGNMDKAVEVEPEVPIQEATMNNSKKELLEADNIFTAEEKEQITAGADAKVWLEITQTDADDLSEEDENAMAEIVKDNMGAGANITYFSADLYKQIAGGEKERISEPGVAIKVTIKISDELLNQNKSVVREYKIVRLHNGKAEIIEGVFNEATGEFTFETDKFSEYAIAYNDTQLATGLTVTADKTTLTKAGETAQLTATVKPDKTKDKSVTWTSGNKEVATVDANGKVTAVADGTVIMTAATKNGISGTITITVKIAATEQKPTNAQPSKKEQEKNALALNAGLKVSQTGSKVNVSWGRVKGADGYEVYVQYCGKKFSSKSCTQVKSGKTTKLAVTKVNGKKLDLKKNYKVYVSAYKLDGKKKVKLGKTITAHIVGRKNSRNTNVKGIKLEKNTFKLTAGKTAKIKGKTVLVDKKKKPLSDAHAKELRYASSNKKVATVSASGKIKAVKKGTCTIYVYARNGYAKKVKVTVK